MYGVLDASEIEQVLRTHQIGRLGVTGGGRVYVVPVSYGYDGASVYIVSHEGLKVQLMRANPAVCFEVEEVTSPAEWRSVIAQGTFEEIHDEVERARALSIIASQGPAPLPPSLAPYLDGPGRVVIYRIRLGEKTGRYEHEEVFRHAAAPDRR
jgi:nitroimidazol reductase NimA-like FMN-containing flavoprotein (pyridoxamine 5'-phosphate oxidase superfamily)